MANKFVLNSSGVRAFLQSNEMLQLTEKYAEQMADGGEIKSFIGFDRAKSIIYGESEKGEGNDRD